MNQNQKTNNTIQSRDSATGLRLLLSPKISGTDLRAPHTKQAEGGKNLKGFGYDRPDRTPERIAKAQAFWSALAERRKQPGNCVRCGKPHDGKTRQCSKCLAYQAKYRGRLQDKNGKLTAGMVVAMVIQMRREMDRMQTRFRLWQKAADYRRNLHYRTNTMRKKYLKTVSHEQAMDYLAKTNHAYENNKKK